MPEYHKIVRNRPDSVKAKDLQIGDVVFGRYGSPDREVVSVEITPTTPAGKVTVKLRDRNIGKMEHTVDWGKYTLISLKNWDYDASVSPKPNPIPTTPAPTPTIQIGGQAYRDVKVMNLGNGDILAGTGEKILNVYDSVNTPTGKINVELKNPKTGEVRTSVWNKYTTVRVKINENKMSKEKQLTIALLAEKLSKLSGKKVKLIEGYYEDQVVWLKPLQLNSNKGKVSVKAGEIWKFERTPTLYFAVKGNGVDKIAVNLDNYESDVDWKYKEVKRAG